MGREPHHACFPNKRAAVRSDLAAAWCCGRPEYFLVCHSFTAGCRLHLPLLAAGDMAFPHPLLSPEPLSFSRTLVPPQCPVLSDSPHTSSAPYPLVMRFAAKGNPRCIQQGNASLLSLNRWETVSIPCGVSAFLVTAGMETEAVGLCVAAH